MAVSRAVNTFRERFNRALTLTTTPEGGAGWTVADTSGAGAPTYATITAGNGGVMELALANDTEVENVCMFQNDILTYDLAQIQHFWYIAAVSSALGATTVLSLGMGSARADDEDAVAVHLYCGKAEGATSLTDVVVESDDGTNDNNDIATGKSFGTTFVKYHCDLSRGLSDVRFFIDGDAVATGTTFDVSNITAGQNVQPIVQISKGATAGTSTVQIAEFGIQYTDAYGA